MFNPAPRIVEHRISPERSCLVIDDALIDPAQLVHLAREQRAAFKPSPHNAYPGALLEMPTGFSNRLHDFFNRHVRRTLGARRTLQMYSRLAMVTKAPHELAPRQWICHRDMLDTDPGRCIPACVLYLFDEPAQGGTSFFVSRNDPRATAQLVHDSGVMSPAMFADCYGITPGYLNDSNAHFERVLTVPPRWNRLIFYHGDVFHCSHIPQPDLLNDDPLKGRLTLNGFFVCRRSMV